MNASAARYSLNYQGHDRQDSDVQEFRDTWRYLVALQRSIGGPKVRWFFCANGEDDVGPLRMEDYWPGRAVVDEVGFDTYNDDWTPWQSFEAKVAPMYDRLAQLAPDLPVTLGEVGCKENGAPPGESKASWTQAMFLSRCFPMLTHVSFLHAVKTINWRLDSSPASLEMHRRYLAGAPNDPTA